jgi:hypothetical protein
VQQGKAVAPAPLPQAVLPWVPQQLAVLLLLLQHHWALRLVHRQPAQLVLWEARKLALALQYQQQALQRQLALPRLASPLVQVGVHHPALLLDPRQQSALQCQLAQAVLASHLVHQQRAVRPPLAAAAAVLSTQVLATLHLAVQVGVAPLL